MSRTKSKSSELQIFEKIGIEEDAYSKYYYFVVRQNDACQPQKQEERQRKEKKSKARWQRVVRSQQLPLEKFRVSGRCSINKEPQKGGVGAAVISKMSTPYCWLDSGVWVDSGGEGSVGDEKSERERQTNKNETPAPAVIFAAAHLR